MAKSKKRPGKKQAYDSTLKEWVQQQPRTIVPLLLAGAVYEATYDVERIRPTMRTDRVYLIMYQGRWHILHLEFESGADSNLIARLLVYHAILYQEYGLPVISMIIYPFRVTKAKSPWKEMSGRKAILTFNFEVLPLYTLEAETYLQKHLTCMYPLLPTMQGVTAEMLLQAMEELVQLYREDEVTLAQQFVWMELLLSRAATIPERQKQEIQRRLSMYDPLWEEHPKVKQIRAESKTEGELKALRSMVVIIVKARFPDLAPLAQERAAQLKDTKTLKQLGERLAAAPDKQAVSDVLSPSVA